jgi:hypothetical protein
MLGRSRVVAVPNAALWLATGNNVELSDELGRRVAPIRLDARTDRPEERTGFKHPLPAYAREHRTDFVGACLSLVRAWLDAGRPFGEATLGRFESWAGILGGILKAADLDGFLGNRAVTAERADTESAEWVALCAAWWTRWGDHPVTAGKLLDLAVDRELLIDLHAGRPRLAGLQRLGHALAARQDRVFGAWVVRSAGRDSGTGSAAYRLERGKTP